MFFFSKKQPHQITEAEHSMLLQSDSSDESFLLKIDHKRTKIVGHITHAAYDLLQVQIDSPYADLCDGYYNDFSEIPEKYWYVKGNRITKLCYKDAKKLLVELYKAAYLFDHERRAMKKALLHGIELGNEYYANGDTPNSEIVEAYGIDQNGKVRRISDPDELVRMKDKRPFEEQRDFFILNRIEDRLYCDHKAYANWDVLSQLIKQCFGISLVYPSPIDKVISERLRLPKQSLEDS